MPDEPDLTAELDAAEDIVMGRAETVVTGPAATPPIVLSVAFQMGPMWRPGRDGEGYGGDLEKFTEGMAHYLSENLERFGEQRGADLFLSVVAQRGDERAGREYRSGHYVKDETTPAADPQ